MAALLVAMSIMAIMMTVVMPVYKQASQREKEEELVFRGKQYVHAIGLFQRKFANAYPPNVDALVEQRFLRKKYKDPITNDDFVPLPVGESAGGGGQAVPGPAPQGAGGGRGPTPTTTTAQPPSRGTPPPGSGGSSRGSGPGFGAGAGTVGGPGISSPGIGGTTGGISGVTSKSKEQSIRLYNGRGHYNEWAFVYTQQNQQPGAGAPGTAVPGQVPGQRGQPPQPGQQGPFGGQRGPGGFGNPGGRQGPGPGQPPPNPRGRF